MSHNCKNYKTDGGNTLVIGGKIKFESGAEIEGASGLTNTPATASTLGLVKIGANINVNSAGVISVSDADLTTKGLVKQGAAVAEAAGDAPTAAEFKALLDSLRAAGIIATAAAAEE